MDPDPSPFVLVGVCLLAIALLSAIDSLIRAISGRRVSARSGKRVPRSRRLVWFPPTSESFTAAMVTLHVCLTLLAVGLTAYFTSHLAAWERSGVLLALLSAILIGCMLLPRLLIIHRPPPLVLINAARTRPLAAMLAPMIGSVPETTHGPQIAAVTVPNHQTPPPPASSVAAPPVEPAPIDNSVSVSDRMVSWSRIPMLELRTPLSHALELFGDSHCSRLLVYNRSRDNVVGLLYAADVEQALRGGLHTRPLSSLLRPVHFVPESLTVGDLRQELDEAQTDLAVVVNELGRVIGTVSHANLQQAQPDPQLVGIC